MATLEEAYKQYQQTQNTDQINGMYDAQKQAQLGALESVYNQNMSNAQAARDQIPQQYQQRANDLAVQYERQRRNLNQQAAANGLNTGAGSQMQLALGSNYNRDYGNLRTAQQQAINDADRGIRDLQSAYQSSVQQAVANNDYQRAQALLSEYQNQYKQQLQQAQTLASYGDFSGYSGIPGYSQQQIYNMRNAWIASNPQLAYNTGALSAEDYYRMTGQWPAGYQNPNAGGGWPYTPQTPSDEVPPGTSLFNTNPASSPSLTGTAPGSSGYNTAIGKAVGALGSTLSSPLYAPSQQSNQSGQNNYIPEYDRQQQDKVAANLSGSDYLNYMVSVGRISPQQAAELRKKYG